MEFGILDVFDPVKNYCKYEPDKYNCIVLDDDLYMNNWYIAALDMPTYFQRFDNPSFSFDRWGVTIIPPSSLKKFLEIVQSDKEYGLRRELDSLSNMIRKAMSENKFMIHFGV